MPASDIGIYIQPQHQGVSQHVEFNFPFDPGDSREAEKVKQLFAEASQALIAQGAYFSRPYGPWAEMVYSRDADATTRPAHCEADRRPEERAQSRKAVLLANDDKERTKWHWKIIAQTQCDALGAHIANGFRST